MQNVDELDRERNEEQISTLAKYKQKFISLFKSNFFPDGYDEVKKKYTYPNIPTEIKNDTSEFWMYFVAFLGLPSRPKAFLNNQGQIVHQLTGKQFLKNLIGGLDFEEYTRPRKKLLQLIGIFPIPIKIGVILAFKLVTFPFKFLLNIVKLLLMVLVPILCAIITDIIVQFAELFEFFGDVLPFPIGFILNMISFVLYIVAMIVGLSLAVTSFFLDLIAQIALAPLSSTRAVYNYFSSVSTLIAFIFALHILAIAAMIWAIALPFVITGVVALFPSVLGAITVVTHIPLIASILTAYSGTFLGLSASIGTFFVPYITALAGLFGLTLSSAGLVSIAGAATIGFFAALIAVPSCYIADTLSDRWAAWHDRGLIAALIFGSKSTTTRFSRHYSETGHVELSETPDPRTQTWQPIPDPSPGADKVVQKKQRGFGTANTAHSAASTTWQRFETGDPAMDTAFNDFVTKNRQARTAPMGQRVELVDDDTAEVYDF